MWCRVLFPYYISNSHRACYQLENYLSSCVAGSYRDVVVVGNYALDSFPGDPLTDCVSQ